MANNINIMFNEDRLELIGLSLLMIGIVVTFGFWYVGLPIWFIGVILYFFKDDIDHSERKRIGLIQKDD